mmetsp:Transcript_16667/g.51730  ORF Transcript_16667/g.51730 Transcript_16667/m.51730 type:complete len:208 (-) Transcript_16667:113-736(-)
MPRRAARRMRLRASRSTPGTRTSPTSRRARPFRGRTPAPAAAWGLTCSAGATGCRRRASRPRRCRRRPPPARTPAAPRAGPSRHRCRLTARAPRAPSRSAIPAAAASSARAPSPPRSDATAPSRSHLPCSVVGCHGLLVVGTRIRLPTIVRRLRSRRRCDRSAPRTRGTAVRLPGTRSAAPLGSRRAAPRALRSRPFRAKWECLWQR